MATLNFKGKSFVQNHHLSVKYHQLVPKKDKSLTDKVSLNDNLIIHGDNLIALKALLPTYAGKVKCIYIDPPYNTGNEKWIYNDNVNSPMIQEWLGKVVDEEDFTRHDKWLCMMMPRLKLLKELLREDGVIFVSIDDNEVYRLRMLMDDIFDEKNFVAQFVVIRSEGGGLAKQAVIGHDYVLTYAKQLDKFSPLKRPKDIRGRVIEKNGIKYWLEEDWLRKEFGKYGTCNYEEIEKYKGKQKKKEIDEGIASGIYQLVKKNTGKHIVVRLRAIGEDASKFYTVLKHLNASGVNDLNALKLAEIFSFPKPVSLIKELVLGATMFTKKHNDIVLDSFAGSGTTAHAVLDLNNEDGGNRKFILVECEEYADKITAERVRRVIKGVKGAKDEKHPPSSPLTKGGIRGGLGGTFSYFELGEPIEMESILEGKKLPDYLELARYIFYTATGEEFVPDKVKKSKNFIGETKDYEVYLFYEPDIEKLKKMALTLDTAKKLGSFTGKKRLVFAPAKYLDLNDVDLIEKHGLKGIEYCQLPFEIYKMRG